MPTMPTPTTTTAPTTPRCDATNLFDTTPPTELTAVQIEERLLGHAAQIATLTARFLELLAEFEDRHTWVGDGILSLAHWLSLRAGLSMRTAHDHVRVARALRNLPRIHTAFTHGQLSYSNVRAITRVATPDREPELLNLALSADAAQVELLVRAMRNIDDHRYQKHNRPPQSTASWRWNTDDTLTVSMRLTPLDGAGFLAAIVRAEYERTRTTDDPDIAPLPDDHPTTDPDTPPAPGDLSDLHLWRNTPANIAPALMLMADTMRTTVDVPVLAPGAEVIIHTHDNAPDTTSTDDSDTDTDIDPAPSNPAATPADPHLHNGPALTDTELAEADCTSSHRHVGHDRRGVVALWGRKRRSPNAAMMRIILDRDHTCRYPGCGRTRHLHTHHVTWWSRGGDTHPDNLILLCSTHHRALHHGAFSITTHALQHFTFHRTDGTEILTAPPQHTPNGWTPAPIPHDAVVPINPGKLDLGYTTEVLYTIWDHRHREQRTTELAHTA
jgi:hypothetical protein